jgi:hypothetical protein
MVASLEPSNLDQGVILHESLDLVNFQNPVRPINRKIRRLPAILADPEFDRLKQVFSDLSGEHSNIQHFASILRFRIVHSGLRLRRPCESLAAGHADSFRGGESRGLRREIKTVWPSWKTVRLESFSRGFFRPAESNPENRVRIFLVICRILKNELVNDRMTRSAKRHKVSGAFVAKSLVRSVVQVNLIGLTRNASLRKIAGLISLAGVFPQWTE